jgi:hypothetical protein
MASRLTIGSVPSATLITLAFLTHLLVESNSLSLDSATGRVVPILFSRRHALVSLVAGTTTALFHPKIMALADEISDPDAKTAPIFNYEGRDRKGNKQAVIREDYWYMFGKTPPRLLNGPLKGADPQWNAFGSCETSETSGTNSCTYVSLKQRIPAYTKYASSIAYGGKEFQRLGVILKEQAAAPSSASSDEGLLWQEAETYLRPEERSPPPAAVDAELKMVLFATGEFLLTTVAQDSNGCIQPVCLLTLVAHWCRFAAMLTSPNFPGPSRELLIARFYANEVRFAHQEILAAIQERDAPRALQAWEFGRDSWNSYFQVVARQIVPKVGDKFEAIV